MPILSGNITGTGATSSVKMGKEFNVSLTGFGSATVKLERSFDEGTTWGSLEAFTENTERVGESHESALYRLNTTVYVSGTIAYRISG